LHGSSPKCRAALGKPVEAELGPRQTAQPATKKCQKHKVYIYRSKYFISRKICQKAFFVTSVGILRSPKMQVMRENAGYKILMTAIE
jgi:hypothetical protein